jgi:hypothetical protein
MTARLPVLPFALLLLLPLTACSDSDEPAAEETGEPIGGGGRPGPDAGGASPTPEGDTGSPPAEEDVSVGPPARASFEQRLLDSRDGCVANCEAARACDVPDYADTDCTDSCETGLGQFRVRFTDDAIGRDCIEALIAAEACTASLACDDMLAYYADESGAGFCTATDEEFVRACIQAPRQ